jgi:protein-tyrosine-phosphatase/predicted ATP-grasp superfamily ATP-dependent carboligase
VKALVLDEGRDRASLVAVRALAADGWTVGTASVARSLASRSRHSTRWHPVPDLAEGPEQFVIGVNRAVESGGYDVLFPAWDQAILELSRRREHISCALPFSQHDVLLRCSDKLAVARVAAEVGLVTPITVPATETALNEWLGPVLIKPSNHSAGMRAQWFADAREAWPAAQAMAAADGRPIAQEVLDGTLMAFAAVADRDGTLVSVSQQIAELTWPLGVGVTARGVTVPIDPKLRNQVAEMLQRLGWFGLVQLQFLLPADRTPRLIDFNGRFYGSMTLAIAAGANHPSVWGRLALGEPVAPRVASAGANYQWLTRDLRSSFASPRRWRELARAARLAPVATHSLWSPEEPWLAPSFLIAQAWRAAKRRVPVSHEPRQILAALLSRAIEPGLRAISSVPPFRRAAMRRSLRAVATSRRPLFVCYGNLNRSPFAAELARSHWPGRTVDAAGYYPVSARQSPNEAVAAAKRFNVDLAGHRSAVLTDAQVESSDAIFVFDAANLAHVLVRRPRAWRRIHLLGSLKPDGPLTISDPHGRPAQAYDEVFDQIEHSVRAGSSSL